LSPNAELMPEKLVMAGIIILKIKNYIYTIIRLSMTKFSCVLFFITLLSCPLHAQVKKKIKKGRRNKSESQFMLDDNYLQVEWETGKETITDNLNTMVYPNLLLRYGISKKLEVNAEMNLVTATDKTAAVKHTSGMEPIAIGINYLLVGEKKNEPAVIFSTQLAIPFLADKNFKANYWAPSFQLNLQQPLNKWLASLSAGAFWDGFNPSASFVYNANVTYNQNQRWAFITELFGFMNGSYPQHSADVSVVYNINKRIQFGCTAGTGISSAAHKNYFAINGVWGYSFKKRPTNMVPK